MEQRTAHVREAPACRVLQRERSFDDAVHVDLILCIRRIRRPHRVLITASLSAPDSGNQISPRRPSICRTFAFALGKGMTLMRSLSGTNRTKTFAPGAGGRAGARAAAGGAGGGGRAPGGARARRGGS